MVEFEGDILGGKPIESREPLVVLDSRLEKVNNIFVLAVLRTVAGNVEGRKAGCVLGEFVAPETWIVLLPCDPVSVHVFE